MSKCPFHRMLRHLKVFAGLPVPYVVEWEDGKPDFRKTHIPSLLHCIQYKLCPVCGKRLGFHSYWVGGPASRASRLFTDAGMHAECARESMRLCPFLSGTRQHYRGDLPTSFWHNSTGRPSTMYLMRGITAKMEIRSLPGSDAIYAGDVLVDLETF